MLVRLETNELAHAPQLLPDGRSLLFTLATGADWDKAQVVVQTVGSSERRTVINGGSDARYLPTGHLVYAIGGALMAVPFDVRKMEVVGGPVPIIEGVARASGGATGSAQFAVSVTGSLMYIPGPAAGPGQFDLALLDRNGTVVPLKLPPRSYQFPRFSPDGHQLAVGIDDGRVVLNWTEELKRLVPTK